MWFPARAINTGVLEGNYSFFGLPLMLLYNPSLMALQNGIPCGVQFSYDAPNDKSFLKAGSVIPLGDNAVGIAYTYTDDLYPHKITTGFSHAARPLYFGSAFTFAINDGFPHLSVDASMSLLSKWGQSVSLIGKSLIGSDTVQEYFHPAGYLVLSGPVPTMEKFLGFDIASFVRSPLFSSSRISYGGSFWLRAKYFKKPPFYISAGTDIARYHGHTLEHVVGGDIGSSLQFESIALSLFVGTRYDLVSTGTSFTTGMAFNPVQNMDKVPPVVSIKVERDTVRNNGFYFSIICNDGPNGSGLKQWTIVIASSPSNEATIIKSYSGGNIPPSSLFWDTRDSRGELHEEETVYIRMVAIDKSSNIGSTPWITIPPLR